MTASVANNVSFLKDTQVVTIVCRDDEVNWTKAPIVIAPPTSMNKQSRDPADPDYAKDTTKIYDIIGKAERRITVNGWLVTGVNPPGGCTYGNDTQSTAQGKKSILKDMFFSGGTLKMWYEGASISVIPDKISVKRLQTEGIASDATNDLAEFDVTISLIEGTGQGSNTEL
jgi:hypothetical protein